jgi:hypothetical protein
MHYLVRHVQYDKKFYRFSGKLEVMAFLRVLKGNIRNYLYPSVNEGVETEKVTQRKNSHLDKCQLNVR